MYIEPKDGAVTKLNTHLVTPPVLSPFRTEIKAIGAWEVVNFNHRAVLQVQGQADGKITLLCLAVR